MDPDLVVVGAGAMGAWTALRALQRGHRPLLLDAFGPGDPRATSSDQTRIIRSSHGDDAFYPILARQAREDWIALGDETGTPIFVPCGAAWFAHRADGFEAASEAVLRRLGIPVERLTPAKAAARWPGIATGDLAFVVHEPEGGALRARAGVLAAVRAFEARRGELRIERVEPGRTSARRLEEVVTSGGARLRAGAFVFAAGPWLPRLFPELVGELITVTKQDVVYLATAPGDDRFEATRLPAWIDFDRAVYGIPSVDGGGAKIASDAYGPAFDPDTGGRSVDGTGVEALRGYLATRLPALAAAPVVATRVCQYEATPDTHFVIDRHPDLDNVWIVGGGSGHGFKHAPQIGRHVVDRLEGAGPNDPGGPPDDRFSLNRKRTRQAGMRSGADSRPTGEEPI